MAKWGGVCLLFLMFHGICRNLGGLFSDVKFYSFLVLSLCWDFPIVWGRHIEYLGCFLIPICQVIIFWSWLEEGIGEDSHLPEMHVLQNLTAFCSNCDKEFLEWSEERRSFNTLNNRSWIRTVRLKYETLW